ncbi:MAG: hypothetical protein JWL77_5351 [Chthonomonadaceae bacterium]|nr:hypothetical protein [Chthonomonadaceae bacterium]
MSNSIALTVYNQDFALVRDTREMEFAAGRNTVTVEDVASRLDRTSVHFKSLTAPESVVVREQNYRYDLIEPIVLLEKSVGKQITLRQQLGEGKMREVKGSLLASGIARFDATLGGGLPGGGMVVRTTEGEIVLHPAGEITLHEMPDGLVSRPQLVWLADCSQSGTHEVEISYMTEGVKWTADYVVVINAEDTAVDLTGWVTLDNRSGATYENANLQLVAGDVRRLPPPGMPPMSALLFERTAMSAAPAPQFEEEKLFEYHLYTLDGTTTVRNNEQKQMTLLAANAAPAHKRFVYDGRRLSPYLHYSSYLPGEHYDTGDYQKVNITMLVENRKPNLGIPLPKGRMRLFKADRQGRLQFVGEDSIDHTPQDETLRLYLGDAFDLVGEHRRTDFKRLGKKQVEERFEILLRNRGNDPVHIVVLEHVWADWEVVNRTHPYEKKDARTLEFPVQVAAGAEVKVSYTIRTRWL